MNNEEKYLQLCEQFKDKLQIPQDPQAKLLQDIKLMKMVICNLDDRITRLEKAQ